MTTRKYILATLCLLSLASQSALSSSAQSDASAFNGQDDLELQHVAKAFKEAHGQSAPKGWRVAGKNYSSEIVDNIDSSQDQNNYLTEAQIEQALKEKVTSYNSKRTDRDTIECMFERHDAQDFDRTGVIHYFMRKDVSLKRDLSGDQQ